MTLKDSETDASVRPDDAGADGALSVDPHGDAAEGDDAHLMRALDLASASATTDGGPFGAVVVAADGRVFEGTNRVTAANTTRSMRAQSEVARHIGQGSQLV